MRKQLYGTDLGVENPDFQLVQSVVMDAIVKQPGVKSIIGGGDSAAAAIPTLARADRFSWISTGGVASMELLEGKELQDWLLLQINNLNRMKGLGQSPNLSINHGLSSKTRWLSVLYYAEFHQLLQPTQLCGGGTIEF